MTQRAEIKKSRQKQHFLDWEQRLPQTPFNNSQIDQVLWISISLATRITMEKILFDGVDNRTIHVVSCKALSMTQYTHLMTWHENHINEYQPKCGDALWLGSKGRHGSFHMRIRMWLAGKTAWSLVNACHSWVPLRWAAHSKALTNKTYLCFLHDTLFK